MPDNAVASEPDPSGPPAVGNLKVRLCRQPFSPPSPSCWRSPGRCRSPSLVLVVALVMSWEWGRVVRGAEPSTSASSCMGIAVTAAVALAGAGYAALAVRCSPSAPSSIIPLYVRPRPLLSALGVFYVGLPAVALLWLRSDEPFGFLAVLFIFVVVWTTDTAAYHRPLHRRAEALATVSPNKTWAGLPAA